jgi:hypothetical protein
LESFGIAHAMEASNFNQLASEYGLQLMGTVGLKTTVSFFDCLPRGDKNPLQNLQVEWVPNL